MNTDAENLSVLVTGFLATSNSKGDLFRRPMGLFDSGDRMSFVFISSFAREAEENINNIKGPSLQFMEIYSIYREFKQITNYDNSK
jgi:hypothetical protein